MADRFGVCVLSLDQKLSVVYVSAFYCNKIDKTIEIIYVKVGMYPCY
jgi:hypothetical protein